MKKFKPQKKEQKIHVYLNNHKGILEETKKKYKVSISTIARITAEEITCLKYYTTDKAKVQRENLTEYYYTSNKLTNDITIKPKLKDNYFWQFETHKKQILFTNALYHYATKFKHLDLEEEQRTKLYNTINNKLNKEKETFWDLNNQIRTQKRAMKIIGAIKQWKKEYT